MVKKRNKKEEGTIEQSSSLVIATDVCYEKFGHKNPKYVLDLNEYEVFGNILPYFLANIATKYYLNAPVKDINTEDLREIYDEFCGSEAYEIKQARPVFLYTANDATFARTCLTPQAACDMLRKALEENKKERETKKLAIKVYGSILPETSEHLKIMLPKIEELGRLENLTISPQLLALAVIGAYISGFKAVKEIHYVFVDVVQEFRVNFRYLNHEVKKIAQRIIEGEGSDLTLRVGIASAIAHIATDYLGDGGRAVLYYVITIRSGNKVQVKSFNQADMTSLATDIAKLGVDFFLMKLVELYPSKERQQNRPTEARKLRNIIESTCKALFAWHSTGNITDLYSIIRGFSSLIENPDELKKLDEFIKQERTGIMLNEIIDGFLRMRLLL